MPLVRLALRRRLSAQRAAQGLVHAVTASELDGQTGLLLDRSGRRVDPPSVCLDADAQLAVLEASSRLVRTAEDDLPPPMPGDNPVPTVSST